jgi:hypothetical protein
MITTEERKQGRKRGRNTGKENRPSKGKKEHFHMGSC